MWSYNYYYYYYFCWGSNFTNILIYSCNGFWGWWLWIQNLHLEFHLYMFLLYIILCLIMMVSRSLGEGSHQKWLILIWCVWKRLKGVFVCVRICMDSVSALLRYQVGIWVKRNSTCLMLLTMHGHWASLASSFLPFHHLLGFPFSIFLFLSLSFSISYLSKVGFSKINY